MPSPIYSIYTHTHTHTCLTALCLGLPGSAGTRKVKPMCILLKQETVRGSGNSWAIWTSECNEGQSTASTGPKTDLRCDRRMKQQQLPSSLGAFLDDDGRCGVCWCSWHWWLKLVWRLTVRQFQLQTTSHQLVSSADVLQHVSKMNWF